MTRPTPPAAFPARPSPLQCILLMAFSAFTISLMHVLVRYLSTELHPFEIAFFRNLVTFCVMVPLVIRAGPAAWRSRRPGIQAARGIIGVIAMMTWFYSLSLVPVADATALSFSAVIFTTIGAVVVLRERLGLHRVSAIAIGVLGMLIIIRPGVETVSLGAVMVLVSTVLWSISLICMKILARTDASVTIVFYSALYFTPLSLIPSLFVWQWPNWEQAGFLVLIGGLATLSHLALTKAFSGADAALLMPVDFTRLIWTAALGAIVFAEFPDIWTWTGGTVIFVSTAYITYRETRAKKKVPEIARPRMPRDVLP